jgi:hypothetical protein
MVVSESQKPYRNPALAGMKEVNTTVRQEKVLLSGVGLLFFILMDDPEARS